MSVAVSTFSHLLDKNGPVAKLEAAVAGGAAVAPGTPRAPLAVHGADLHITGTPLSVAALARSTSVLCGHDLHACSVLGALAASGAAAVPGQPVTPNAIDRAVQGRTHILLGLLQLVWTRGPFALCLLENGTRPVLCTTRASLRALGPVCPRRSLAIDARVVAAYLLGCLPTGSSTGKGLGQDDPVPLLLAAAVWRTRRPSAPLRHHAVNRACNRVGADTDLCDIALALLAPTICRHCNLSVARVGAALTRRTAIAPRRPVTPLTIHTLVGALSGLLRDSALEVGLFSRHGVAGPASKGSFLRNISVAHLRSFAVGLAAGPSSPSGELAIHRALLIVAGLFLHASSSALATSLLRRLDGTASLRCAASARQGTCRPCAPVRPSTVDTEVAATLVLQALTARNTAEGCMRCDVPLSRLHPVAKGITRRPFGPVRHHTVHRTGVCVASGRLTDVPFAWYALTDLLLQIGARGFLAFKREVCVAERHPVVAALVIHASAGGISAAQSFCLLRSPSVIRASLVLRVTPHAHLLLVAPGSCGRGGACLQLDEAAG
mmetsp:Transcript_36791/g.86363  ORF Transcript_36791/g.86363 Transcript_36791/m.86363 type:complete len:550 (-) Transcript_36791:35-1684(-)